MSRHLFVLLCLLAAILTACSSNEQSSQVPPNTLRITFDDDPSSLDPRLLRDISGVTVSHMLFEGLMRRDLDGQLVPGVAKEVAVSDDHTTYTFYLRDSKWSNGDPITADDFVYAWRSILEPTFPSPNAYQLFVIKNGKAIKDGTLPSSALGVTATAANVLTVELERPIPYFLALLDFHPFFPVHSKQASSQPEWAKGDPALLVNNGPYLLDTWDHQHELKFTKNPHYWDQENVLLDRVHTYIVDSQTALHMFEAGEVDWVGSPCGTIPIDTIPTLKQMGILSVTDSAGTRWLRLNTAKKPLDNKNFRQALSYALNREQLAKHVHHGVQQPAVSLVPPSIFSAGGPCFEDHNLARAKELFSEALTEMQLSADQLPAIGLSYSGAQAMKLAEAIQQQLNEALGVRVELIAHENKILYDHLSRKQYQMALGSWIADFPDASNFLDLFKYKVNGTNNTEWEDAQYQYLLTQAAEETDSQQREELLRRAEQMIMDASPVIPLSFLSFLYVKRDDLHDIYFSPLGYIDVRAAIFDED